MKQSTGIALKCTKCKSAKDPCTGDLTETCTAEQQCMSIYATTVIDGKSTDSVTRMCGLKTNCNKVGSYSTPSIKYKMSTTCCQNDLCVPKNGNLPEDFKNPNSHKCPYCKLDAESCNTGEMLNCSGNENSCLTMVTKRTESTQSVSVARGCATKTICEFGIKNESYPTYTNVELYDCSGGPAVLYRSSTFTFYAVCVLLIKLFI
uniref:UPAR/Ly6 domain-containing protein n=1 Tax=Leptobrachium leishanense TaxID=445787 RepID=A0A8C5QWR6_9ANUR